MMSGAHKIYSALLLFFTTTTQLILAAMRALLRFIYRYSARSLSISTFFLTLSN